MSKRLTWAEVKARRERSFEYEVSSVEARIAIQLGERIRHAREAAGLSQAQLAQRAEMQQPAVARFEAGDVEPTIRTIVRLSRALGLSVYIELQPAAEPPLPSGAASTVTTAMPVS